MIAILKDILDINDDLNDTKLGFYLRYVEDYVKSYCNIKEIPNALQTTIVYLTAEIYGQLDNKKTISMGDISYTLQDNKIFSQYKSVLNRFRKLGR